jgi:hypothetical protein
MSVKADVRNYESSVEQVPEENIGPKGDEVKGGWI